MIGLILITHGRLAEAFREAMEHIVGPQQNLATVCISPDDDLESRCKEIQGLISKCNTGDGVILLTDIFGGTPSNLAIAMMELRGVEVIAGMNLPMLVKLGKIRSAYPLADAARYAEDAGRKYIELASNVLQSGGEAQDGH